MEFIHALSLQGKVIAALTLRETRSRYGSSKLGYFWALFEPFAHVMVFIGIFSALDRAPPIGQSTGLFILTGIIPWLLFSNIVNGVMGGLQANKALLGYPQVMPMDISVSRVILESSTLFLVMLFFLAVASYMGLSVRIDSFLKMMSATGLLILLAMGIGLINAALVTKYPSYKSIYSAISRPLYFISGVFFTADFLSPEVYDVVSINPLLHLIEWFRSGFYTSYNSD
ncbi:MAG: ABC transporter permease, partial [Thiotrichaceae bacterium]|nr:ABC transporter permease [Thiotrichaceae bacterium]